MRERTIFALWKRLAGGQRLRLRVVSVLVIALGSAALLMGPGMDPTARAQTTVDYDGDDDGLIEVATVAQLNAIRWDLNGDGTVDPGGDVASYGEAFPNAMVSPLMGCAATGCVGYELTADLDLASAGDSVTGWAPIGGASNAFTATFDGGALGFTVSNLTINSSLDRVGLFGETGPGSVIRNVTLEDVNVTGHIGAGALVGRNAGSIIDSSATGAVSGTEDTGGLVGAILHPGSFIVGSTAGVQVTGRAAGLFIGGLAGFNKGLIIDSHATGDVTGFKWVGGLVGSNNGGGGVNRISGSTAGGAVTGTDLVGGLVGWNNGPIIDSHATGDVNGRNWVGGLVGSNSGAGGVNRISGSTAGGAVTGTGSPVGGLVGWNNGPISSSHATGDVSGSSYVGGLVGENSGAGGVNRISGSTAAGAVTSDNSRVGGLVGQNNGPISSSHATGTVVVTQSVGGLVGSNYDDDAWNGLRVGLNAIGGSTAGGAVTGTGNWVGGLVGWNNGPISDSHATGTRVSGSGQVGGLVGTNENQTANGFNTISRSTASAAVTGTGNWVGGLVGNNNGPISSSHATGDVDGNAYVGGLVGDNTGPISDSHARGSVQGLHESGGLVGWNFSPITDSSASGDVGDAATAGQTLGGLIGLNSGGGAVTRSNATGDVASTSDTIGGLVGRNEDTITESAASGAVTGSDWVGGLVGWNGLINNTHSISASRASGNVTGSGQAAGGLVGRNAGTISASYATGTVTGVVSVGGLVGRLLGAIVAAYASGDVSGSGNAVGGLVGQSNSTPSSVLASYAAGSVSGERRQTWAG